MSRFWRKFAKYLWKESLEVRFEEAFCFQVENTQAFLM